MTPSIVEEIMQREIDLLLPLSIRDPGRQECFNPLRKFRRIVVARFGRPRLLQSFGFQQIGYAPIMVAEAGIGIRSKQEAKNVVNSDRRFA